MPQSSSARPAAGSAMRCEVEGSPGGDEQSVVDHLMRRLLGTLGYRNGDITQNRKLPGQRMRAVPDFTVRVAEYLPHVAVFVIEDKATDVRNLEAKARSGGRDESPIEQLRRYACSGAVHGRSGLLCNGWMLEGWSFGGDADTRVVTIDLHALSAEVDAQPAATIDGRWGSALLALWMRFSRRAFEDAAADLKASIAVPPLPIEEVRAINERFAATQETAAIEQILDSYLERVWRQDALDVAASTEILVDALRALIDEFADDVRHQLDDALLRDEHVRMAAREAEDKADVSGARQRLALLRPRFDRTEEEFAEVCLAPVDAWRSAPRPGGVTELTARLRKALGPHVRITARKAGEQRTLLGAGEVVGHRKGGDEAGANDQRRQALDALEQGVREVCARAAEARAARQELETEHRASLAAAQAWSAWEPRVSSSVMVGASAETLRAEFARQTAYVFVVRLLLVRICEDKGLFARKLSDGGLVRWQEDATRYLDYASGRSYEYVTRMAYECAQNVYAHFYGASEVFDWYRMDEKIVLRALVVLNAFNLERIDTDIIGTVYGRYLQEGKHEQGRYYTAPPLVRAILDRAGYVRGAIADKRIGDLACGSGSFLVEACIGLYRRLVEEQPWFETKYLKWDLYVPFVEQYLRLLSDDPDARCCLVTIMSLETVPYAAKLREKLATQATVHGVLFTEKLKLFADAKWQDNIVLWFSRGAPPQDHQVGREIARGFSKTGDIDAQPLDFLPAEEATADRIFNRREQVALDLEKTVALEELCYVTVGMVLNSDEKIRAGEIVRVPASYDPRRFDEELVRRGGFGPVQWIEFGDAGRCPSRVRRSTFPELYEHPKLMFGAFTGVAVDAGEGDGFVIGSDTVRFAVRWCLLEGVQSRALADGRRALGKRYEPKRSERISEWYLCGLALSAPIQRWLHANRRSMKEHVYPEDIKAIPIKLLTPKQQEPFIDLAKERHRLWSEVIALEARGYKAGDVPVWDAVKAFRDASPKLRFWRLVHAATSDVLKIDQAFVRTPLRGLRSQGDAFLLKRETVGRLGSAVKADREAVARVLARVLSALPATYVERENIDEIPATIDGLLSLGRFLEAQEREVQRRMDRINEINAEIDRRAWRLYRPKTRDAAEGEEEEED